MLILNVVTKKRELKFVATKVVKEEVVRVRVDKDLKDRLKKMCKDKKVTMSEMITFMIENEVESYEFKLKNSDDTEKRIVVTEKNLLKLKEKLNSNKKEIGMKSRWRFIYWSNEVALPKGVRLLGIRRVPSETKKNFWISFL